MNKEIVEDVFTIPLKGLDRKLLFILNNHSKWISVKILYKIVLAAFRDGIVDRPYNYQWVCSRLRYLESLGLISKKESQNSWGRSSLYVINSYGIQQLRLNLNTNSTISAATVVTNSNNKGVCNETNLL